MIWSDLLITYFVISEIFMVGFVWIVKTMLGDNMIKNVYLDLIVSVLLAPFEFTLTIFILLIKFIK
jgi:hypothetical protein